MRLPLTLLLSFIYFISIKGQSYYEAVGSSNIATANTSTVTQNLWSGFHNPAAITQTDQYLLGLSFQNHFGVSQLNSASAGLILPLSNSALFAGIHRFGDEIYNEHRLALAYATKVGNTTLGGRINYFQTHISDYGVQHDYGLDLGVLSKLHEQFLIGISLYNLTNYASRQNQINTVPAILSAGFQYIPLPYFHLNFEIEKNLVHAAFAKFSLQYKLKDRLQISSGIRSDNWQNFYGVTFCIPKMDFSYALSSHSELGLSHSVGIIYKR